MLKQGWFGAIGIGVAVPALLVAQAGRGPYARIAVLRPHDGQTTEFEAGDRYRWFVYASFGHSATSFDSLVNPAEDERDNLMNVAPHVEWVTNGVYEFLPILSRGNGEPTPTPRLEYTIVDLNPGADPRAFERSLTAAQGSLKNETLWYKMVAGGPTPRYVRLRPLGGLSAILNGSGDQALPDGVKPLVAKTTIEIWSFRPTMSLGVGPPPRP
jgi:hypothetical protein